MGAARSTLGVESSAMPPQAAYLTLGLSVTEMRRSIEFYQLLGMELMDINGDPAKPYFARLHSEGGDLILLPLDRAFENATIPKPPFTWFVYLYTDQLPALREHLIAHAVKVSEINHPEYMPKGEICVPDPDGYGVFVGQWDPETHKNWEKERKERLAKFEAK